MTRIVLVSVACTLAMFVVARPQAQPATEPHVHDAHGHSVGGDDPTPAMTSEHLHSDVHMKITAVRPANAYDGARAAAVVAVVRPAIEKYKDDRMAEADGYRPFLENIPQPQYHFTNYWRALKAALSFNPAEPASLLYRKSSEGYELIGAMYTAPRWTSEERLDERVPLSVARWHAHVNICLPPQGAGSSADLHTFGFQGSIATREDCDKAGGRFRDQIFGWMVHVYPFEKTPDQIWKH